MATNNRPRTTVLRGVRIPATEDSAADTPAARGVETNGNGSGAPRAGAWDVMIDDGQISQIIPAAHGPPPPGSEVVAAEGRYLLPGLWDEHTHMVQWALAMSRLDLSQATSAADALDLVAAARPADGGPLVGYGFRDATW